jgi:hypothetical protein
MWQIVMGPDAGGNMKKVSIDDGDPLTICDVEADTPGVAWMDGGRILFSAGWIGAPLVMVSADGGPAGRTRAHAECARPAQNPPLQRFGVA